VDITQAWIKALCRDAIGLVLLNFVAPFRRWRRWYWRAMGIAGIIGAVYGWFAYLQERRAGSFASRFAGAF
jgi:hypothetical protein